ncbi:ATP-binding protein [Desulfonatronum lacustre]|uniref:ATP-binding protein n=1 Tax=Desulfonatronum lacustre TaxID=66849 RepID=UPI00048BF0F2|nr:ATP-binding protein [Desulfonatronum lacustre]
MRNHSLSFKLTAPCDMAALPLVLAYVREAAVLVGFAGDDISRIELAVEEAVSNVVQHAFLEDDEPGAFDIVCEQVTLGLRIIIREKGIPFDPGKAPVFEQGDDLEQVSARGMGMALMRQTMDEVAFHNLGPDGKETRLVKYLPGKSVHPGFEAQGQDVDPTETAFDPQPTDSAPAPKTSPPRIDYTVRRMTADEAIEVSRSAYKNHGYTFFNEVIYYPERMAEMNAADDMISAVAVTGANEFMGHAALVFEDAEARTAEYTFLFVNQAFRNQGCMERLTRFLLTTPKTRPLTGVYSYSVANHVFTQRGLIKLGYRDCGILLATSPATWKFKGIDEPGTQRISVVVSFVYLEQPSPRQVFAPPHHREMIGRILEHIGAPHVLASPPQNPPSLAAHASRINTKVYPLENCAMIKVHDYGSDCVREVRRILRELCLKQVAAIDLLLPLDDPTTCFVTTELEKLGFFFSGIQPEAGRGDALILQYLNNIPFDYDKVQVFSDLARDLLAYIRRHDPNENL